MSQKTERRRADRRKTVSRQAAGPWSGGERRKADRRRGDRRRSAPEQDNDLGKGAVESDQPGAEDQVSMSGQLPHRAASEAARGQDTDFPEPGQNPEHSGQRKGRPPKGGKR